MDKDKIEKVKKFDKVKQKLAKQGNLICKLSLKDATDGN